MYGTICLICSKSEVSFFIAEVRIFFLFVFVLIAHTVTFEFHVWKYLINFSADDSPHDSKRGFDY